VFFICRLHCNPLHSHPSDGFPVSFFISWHEFEYNHVTSSALTRHPCHPVGRRANKKIVRAPITTRHARLLALSSVVSSVDPLFVSFDDIMALDFTQIKALESLFSLPDPVDDGAGSSGRPRFTPGNLFVFQILFQVCDFRPRLESVLIMGLFVMRDRFHRSAGCGPESGQVRSVGSVRR